MIKILNYFKIKKIKPYSRFIKFDGGFTLDLEEAYKDEIDFKYVHFYNTKNTKNGLDFIFYDKNYKKIEKKSNPIISLNMYKILD